MTTQMDTGHCAGIAAVICRANGGEDPVKLTRPSSKEVYVSYKDDDGDHMDAYYRRQSEPQDNLQFTLELLRDSDNRDIRRHARKMLDVLAGKSDDGYYEW